MTNKTKLVEYINKYGKTESWERLSKRFGLVSADSARKTWRNYKNSMGGIKDILKEGISDVLLDTKETVDYKLELSEYLAKAKASLDKELDIVSLEEMVTKLARENADPKARLVRSMNPGPNPLDYSLELQKETILAEMRKNSSISNIFRVDNFNTPRKDNLLELSMFDLHIGKLSWDKETGEDYDIDIATRRYKDAVAKLISRVDMSAIDRILLPIGNDMINIDGKAGTTTAGTPQDGDSRFGKMFKMAKELIIDVVNSLKMLAPVDVVVIPGNHDELTMFTLGEVLDAWYHNDSEVKVFNSPKLRKYYQYGQNMIMFTHGNREKHVELGLIAASEEPKMWADTKFREVHVGHFHKSKVIQYVSGDEYQGFKVRILPSLSGTDAWHYSKGYMSQKAAKAFVWNKEEGLISEHTFTIV